MRKKSIRTATERFREKVDGILDFTKRIESSLTASDISWCYDIAIIRLYLEFEDLMLNCLVAFLNRDPEQFSKLKQREFPKHMNTDLCKYLIYGDGYFDFSGRDGIIRKIRNFIPKGHWFPQIVSRDDYRDALDKLCALRNFAAHDSAVSKKRALGVIGEERSKLSSSGAWLKTQGRLKEICNDLQDMAQKIEDKADF